MVRKVLFVLTSQKSIPADGSPTGWYLPEFAHPYAVIEKKAEVVVASPRGGEAPLDPGSVGPFASDPVCATFLQHERPPWKNTVKLAEIRAVEAGFDALFFVGGHGPMFDIYTDPDSLTLIRAFTAARKPIAAVCHGPVAFLQAVDHTTGKPVLAGASVTGFSNVEEDQAQKTALMPFKLQDHLDAISGGGYVRADQPWGEKVVVSSVAGQKDGPPLITGQNPASAHGVAVEILKAIGL